MDASKTGKFISELRKQNNLTQKELARMLDVSDKAISRWETGKGYPDIETLPRIAECLSTTISELLNGEQEPENINDNTEEKLCEVCNTVKEVSAKKKRRIKGLIIALVVMSILLISCILVSVFTSLMVNEYNSIVGSENCVIASDHSELNYFGMRYLPIIVPESSNIKPSEKVLIKEAQVEGYGYLAKLPFGEMIYATDGVDSNDIIYLQTDGIIGYSRFFCKEEKYDYYYNKLAIADYAPSDCFIKIQTGYIDFESVTISDSACKYLTRLKKSDSGLHPNYISSQLVCEFDLYTFEEYSVNLGTLKVMKDCIYFCPSVVFRESDDVLYYKLNDECEKYFEGIFSKDCSYQKSK